MQTVLAWVFLPCLVLLAYPMAYQCLRKQGETWLSLPLMLGLSAGLIAMISFVFGLVGVPLRWEFITPVYLVITIPFLRGFQKADLPRFQVEPNNRWFMIALSIFCLGSLFTALYWPFYRDDTLGIYLPAAQTMFQTGRLEPLIGADSLYRAYPILIPLQYVYVFSLSGWENEYLAKLIPTLMGLACMSLIYGLAKRMHPRAGWVAVGILAFTPSYIRWIAAGYVDLPMAFYLLLALHFSLRLWDHKQARDAILLGVMIGLATFTKNAALVSVPLFGGALIIAWLAKRVTLRHILIVALSTALIGGGWYLRNLIGAGFIMPDTAWTEQAEHTVANLFVFVSNPLNFLISGVIVTLSIFYGVWQIITRRFDAITELLILGISLPFFFAWWWLTSYDPRFLLLFYPPLCALGASMAMRVYDRCPAPFQSWIYRIAIVYSVVLIAYGTWTAIEYKNSLIHGIGYSHEEKLVIVGRIPSISE